jgi:hypothetical protein
MKNGYYICMLRQSLPCTECSLYRYSRLEILFIGTFIKELISSAWSFIRVQIHLYEMHSEQNRTPTQENGKKLAHCLPVSSPYALIWYASCIGLCCLLANLILFSVFVQHVRICNVYSIIWNKLSMEMWLVSDDNIVSFSSRVLFVGVRISEASCNIAPT